MLGQLNHNGGGGGGGGRRSKCKPKASTGTTKWRNYMYMTFPLVYMHCTTLYASYNYYTMRFR